MLWIGAGQPVSSTKLVELDIQRNIKLFTQNKRSHLSAGSRSRSADAEMPALAALDQAITDVG